MPTIPSDKDLLKLVSIVPTIRAAIRSAGTHKQVMTHLLPKMDLIYRRSMDLRFRTQNAARGVGGEWLPLSPAYARWKRTQVGNQPLLSFTRQMRGSFTGKANSNHIATLRKGVIFMGSSHSRAVQHDFGINTPQRMLRGASDETVEEFKVAITKYLQDFMASRAIRELGKLKNGTGLSAAQQGVSKQVLMKRLGTAS